MIFEPGQSKTMRDYSRIFFSTVFAVAAIVAVFAMPSSLLAQDKESTPEKAKNQKFDLTFDDLKFEMEKGSKFDRKLLTEKINSYNSNTVKIRGYIRPAFSQTGLKKFIFVRDNKECCFGPGAALYDCVLVTLAKGKKTDYTVRPVTVEGKFKIDEYKGVDGKVWAIYRMTDTLMK
jgi:hypothetical protein